MWSNHSLPIDCRLPLRQHDHKALGAVMIKYFLRKSVARHCQSLTTQGSYNAARRLNLTSPIYSALSKTEWMSWHFSPQLECKNEWFISHGRNSRLRSYPLPHWSRWMGFDHEPIERQTYIPTQLGLPYIQWTRASDALLHRTA